MTIDEAIKVKEKYALYYSGIFTREEVEADKLAIEALKRIQKYRPLFFRQHPPLLPGETGGYVERG